MREACLECLRRGWLLARLSARLGRRHRDPQLLRDLLALPDESLIQAIGGRRRAELHEEHRRFHPSAIAAPAPGAHLVCRHDDRYPSSIAAGLSAAGPPSAAPWPSLYVLGRIDRAGEALANGVAVVGTRRASDYGMHVAHALARDLARSGIEVSAVFGEGIAFAALSGALQADGAPLAMMAGSIDRCSPASCAPVFWRLATEGFLLAQLPPGTAGRRWAALLACRTVLLASRMTVVVEMERGAGELACVEEARAAGKVVGAVPGRLTSPAAGGVNDLLRDGAVLVRDVHDVLGALHGVGAPEAPPDRSAGRLGPRAQATLDAVGAGNDTLAKLLETGIARADTVLALAELELDGLLVRGDGGRYMPSLGSQRLERFDGRQAR